MEKRLQRAHVHLQPKRRERPTELHSDEERTLSEQGESISGVVSLLYNRDVTTGESHGASLKKKKTSTVRYLL